MNRIPCEMIQDLLPSYIDELTSDVTNEHIREHLADCESCQSVWRNMRDADGEWTNEEEQTEIDFLKKTKRSTKRLIAGCIAAAAVIIAGVLFAGNYLVQTEMNSQYIVCDIDVNNSTLRLSGGAVDERMVVSDVDFVQDGEKVVVHFKGTGKGLFRDNTFEQQFTATEDIREVWFDDRIVWSKGETISPITSALFQSAHPYVGDMSANGSTARALHIANYLGDFTNELHTGEQPYGWSMKLTTAYSGERQSGMEAMMHSFACAFLAVIDNLDFVAFEYTIDDKTYTLRVTADDASIYAGFPIKDAGTDINLLEQLVRKTELNTMAAAGDSSTEIPMDTIRISLANFSKTPLAGMGIRLSGENGADCSQYMIHADNSALVDGEVIDFELIPGDFNGEIWNGTKMFSIQVTVTGTDGTEKEINQKVSLAAAYGRVYHLDIVGDMSQGYQIEVR